MSTSHSNPAQPRTGPLGIALLHTRYSCVVLPLFLSIIMTCVVSLVSTLHGFGLAIGMLQVWLGSWAWSWAIAFPTLLVVLPFVRRATYAIVQMPHESEPD